MKNTMRQHIRRAIASIILGVALLSGCGGILPGTTGAFAEEAGSVAAVQTISTEGLFSNRDMNQGYETADAVMVQLDGSTSVCASDDVRIDGGQITLLDEGVYVFSGILDDGQIIVNADSADKVQIVLNGASITSASSAAIYCLQADKVFLTLAAGSENVLSNGGAFEKIDDNDIDAVVYAKTDLTLNGAGSLTVNSPAGHGVVSKDELTITGGTFAVNAFGHGFAGKDSVAIADGCLVIASGKDGIHADDAVAIQAGSLSIPTCYEGVEGQSVTIDGGTLDITAMDDGINAAGGNDGSGTGFGFGRQDQFASDGSCLILINGGTITIVSDGDSIDSNGSLTVNGGTLRLTCNGNGNTAIDTNGTFTHNGGSITTNDGSESGGGMGGGHGAMGGAKPSRNGK